MLKTDATNSGIATAFDKLTNNLLSTFDLFNL